MIAWDEPQMTWDDRNAVPTMTSSYPYGPLYVCDSISYVGEKNAERGRGLFLLFVNVQDQQEKPRLFTILYVQCPILTRTIT